MPSKLLQVRDFHEGCGQFDPTEPTDIAEERAWLRARLMAEELQELMRSLGYSEAIVGFDLGGRHAAPDWAHVLKELSDLRYVIYGTACELGLDAVADKAFNRVHKSNLSKFEEGGAVRDEGGKIMKGEHYRPPELGSLVQGS